MGRPFLKYHSQLWVEKYRPQSLSDYIASSDMKEKFSRFIDDNKIPHLLFEGPAGTGKSTLANLLVKELDCESHYINASEENGIDTVREVITKFCKTSSFSPLKVMVLDEFSEFTKQAQDSLRSIMERYSANTRFILTCNNVENIIDPIRSRCQEFKVIPPSKEQVLQQCKDILGKEGIDFDDIELSEIVRHNYPDVRKTIQYLDQQSIGKVLKLDKEFFKLLKYEEKIVDTLKTVKESNMEDKVNDIRQLVADTRVRNFTTIYKTLYEKIDIYTPKKKIVKVIFQIQEGLKSDAIVADKEINLVATLLGVMETITA